MVTCRVDPPFLDERPSSLGLDPMVYYLNKLDRIHSVSGLARTSSDNRQAGLDVSMPDRLLRL